MAAWQNDYLQVGIFKLLYQQNEFETKKGAGVLRT